MSEYREIANELDDQCLRPTQSKKYYNNVNLVLRDIDEYVFFKKHLLTSFAGNKEQLKNFIMRDKIVAKVVEMVLKCKRIRISREGNKEYIRLIYNFAS